jgi:beta-galactosidase/beta-glucuronidase
MHTIRLRGPWEYEPLECAGGEGSLPPNGKVTMPCDWGASLGSDFRGTVQYRRIFHTPTGLDLGEQVWLAFDAVRSEAAVTLNGQPVGDFSTADCPARYNITAILTDDANLLEVRVTHLGEQSGGIVGDVRLEIEE